LKEVSIVAPFKVVSHHLVARRIAAVFEEQGVKTEVYDLDWTGEVPGRNLLYVGAFIPETFSYCARFMPEKNIVVYGAIEGFPIMDSISVEKEIAQDMNLIAVSKFSQMCMETVGIPINGVIYHGVPMDEEQYDTHFLQYIRKFNRGGPTVLCNSANYVRKALANFMLASKFVNRAIAETFFILHSAEGAVNIPMMIEDLQLKNFWWTNSYGTLTVPRVNTFYKACKVNVLPSYCEGFGLPIIEAMAFNRPTVAVDAQPYNEIIENGKTGILIPVTNTRNDNWQNRIYMIHHHYSIDALANAIIALLSQPDVLNRMEKAISEEKKRFDFRKTYVELLKYW